MAEPENRRGPDLGERIEAARAATKDAPSAGGSGKYVALTLAWRMVVELVAGAAIGSSLGWGLDSLFGSKPALMIVFGLLGFAAGAKIAIESARRIGQSDTDDASGGAGS